MVDREFDIETPRFSEMRGIYEDSARQLRQVIDVRKLGLEPPSLDNDDLLQHMSRIKTGLILQINEEELSYSHIDKLRISTSNLTDALRLREGELINTAYPFVYTDAASHARVTVFKLAGDKLYRYDPEDPIDNLHLGDFDSFQTRWDPLQSHEEWLNFFGRVEKVVTHTVHKSDMITRANEIVPVLHFLTEASRT